MNVFLHGGKSETVYSVGNPKPHLDTQSSPQALHSLHNNTMGRKAGLPLPTVPDRFFAIDSIHSTNLASYVESIPNTSPNPSYSHDFGHVRASMHSFPSLYSVHCVPIPQVSKIFCIDSQEFECHRASKFAGLSCLRRQLTGDELLMWTIETFTMFYDR